MTDYGKKKSDDCCLFQSKHISKTYFSESYCLQILNTRFMIKSHNLHFVKKQKGDVQQNPVK